MPCAPPRERSPGWSRAHSTNTSEARRSAIPDASTPQTLPPMRPTYQRAFAALLACAAAVTLAALTAAADTQAASRNGAQALVVRGAGDGHGVGMSQWG